VARAYPGLILEGAKDGKKSVLRGANCHFLPKKNIFSKK